MSADIIELSGKHSLPYQLQIVRGEVTGHRSYDLLITGTNEPDVKLPVDGRALTMDDAVYFEIMLENILGDEKTFIGLYRGNIKSVDISADTKNRIVSSYQLARCSF